MRTPLITMMFAFGLLTSGCSSVTLTPTKGGMVSNTLCSVSIGDCGNPALTEENDSIIGILTGKPIAFIQARLGLPNRRNELASGAKVWTYFDNSKGLTAKSCKISLSIRNDIVERVHISTDNASFASFLSEGCQRIRKDIS